MKIRKGIIILTLLLLVFYPKNIFTQNRLYIQNIGICDFKYPSIGFCDSASYNKIIYPDYLQLDVAYIPMNINKFSKIDSLILSRAKLFETIDGSSLDINSSTDVLGKESLGSYRIVSFDKNETKKYEIKLIGIENAVKFFTILSLDFMDHQDLELLHDVFIDEILNIFWCYQ